MKPQVGDIVWYTPAQPRLERRRSPPWPATVTKVHNETDVTLHVYPPNGRIMVRPHASRGEAPGQWLRPAKH